MCGISILWGAAVSEEMSRVSLERLRHRGPDAQSLEHFGGIWIGFTRLHIQGSADGVEQPFRLGSGSETRVLCNGERSRCSETRVLCNGELFNAEILTRQLDLPIPPGSSDCAVIPALLGERGMSLSEASRQLDGDFAIVVVRDTGIIEVSRDPYGVRPLFWGRGDGWQAIASELKGFPDGATEVLAVQPGTVMIFGNGSGGPEVQPWHEVPWLKTPYWRSSLDGLAAAGTALRHALEEAVAKRLTTIRGLGACLSGGLDSSLVAAIAARRLARCGRRLHTYSIGMSGSPDLEHARQVAAHIGSIHHERVVSPEECLAAIPTVIRAIETFDVTTVRASVGNYLVGQLVATETPDVKVVLNGDGADEVFGGYLYMRAAPDDAAFETETDRLLREIHQYDVLRSERSMAAHSLESRSPFLDRQLVSVARGLPTEVLRPSDAMMEKTILRTAFVSAGGLLPESVLWRRKEAFSDGISGAGGPSWYEMAREEGVRRAASEAPRYAVNPPQTAEALWYRQLFHEHFPEAAAVAMAPAMWMPRFVAGATDPSARTLNLYGK